MANVLFIVLNDVLNAQVTCLCGEISVYSSRDKNAHPWESQKCKCGAEYSAYANIITGVNIAQDDRYTEVRRFIDGSSEKLLVLIPRK